MTTRDRDRRDRGDRGDGAGGIEKVVSIKRVTKVVKGGKHFHFNAMVVVGDGAGQVGIGLGKSAEVPDAVKKGAQIARKHMIRVSMKGSTIPHEVLYDFGAARVMLKPAAPGTGVIAGGSVRAVVVAAGIRDILTKSLGTPNPINVVKATYMALESLQFPEQTVANRKALALALAASPPPEPRSPRPPRPAAPKRDMRPKAEARPPPPVVQAPPTESKAPEAGDAQA